MYDEDDRTQQINAINQLAANIAKNFGEGTAQEKVTYALSIDGMITWGIELPGWFDSRDREILLNAVAENQGEK